jgi:hypothetical protein
MLFASNRDRPIRRRSHWPSLIRDRRSAASRGHRRASRVFGAFFRPEPLRPATRISDDRPAVGPGAKGWSAERRLARYKAFAHFALGALRERPRGFQNQARVRCPAGTIRRGASRRATPREALPHIDDLSSRVHVATHWSGPRARATGENGSL